MKRSFSKWHKWSKRTSLKDIEYPGIYALMVTNEAVAGSKFKLDKQICYFGMTNSLGGLIGRLGRFHNTINWKEGHGGAQRFRTKYNSYDAVKKNLYVSVMVYKCNTKTPRPKDIRMMGIVAKKEYYCIAEYFEKFGKLPRFNDKKNAPKSMRPKKRSLKSKTT